MENSQSNWNIEMWRVRSHDIGISEMWSFGHCAGHPNSNSEHVHSCNARRYIKIGVLGVTNALGSKSVAQTLRE